MTTSTSSRSRLPARASCWTIRHSSLVSGNGHVADHEVQVPGCLSCHGLGPVGRQVHDDAGWREGRTGVRRVGPVMVDDEGTQHEKVTVAAADFQLP